MESVYVAKPKSTEVQVALVAFLVSALAYKLFRKLTSNEMPPPPGPWGFPVLGHLPLLGKEPNRTFMKMRKKFGDIFQIKMGSWTTVVVNGKRAIREALQDRGDDFSGRPQFVSSTLVSKGESLTFGRYDEKWRIHRKLANRVLFEFSNAKKNPIEDMVQEEVDILVNCFMLHAGTSFDPREYLYLSVASIIYQICYGREENIRDSEDFETFLKNSGEFAKFVSAGNPVDVMPWLQYFMPWRLTKFTNLVLIGRAFRNKRVDEHRQNFSADHMGDITDGLLAASREETRLTEDRIVATVDAIFGAGLETVNLTLRWGLLLMAAHPEVQKRVQAEIDDIVGDGRRPGIQDRGQLVYTEAVLHEIHRYVALVPLSLPHAATRDTQLGGFSIKKDTVIFINLYSMNHDKDVWGDPEVFRPERFLDESGKIKKCMLEEFLPFSTGNRKCLGELLARNEVFLFFSGLLHRYAILKPKEVTEYNMDCQYGLTRQCLPFTIQVQLRQ